MSQSSARPVFLFLVDTEGDNEWVLHRRIPSVRNLQALPRFQTLCERYGIKPTYVCTYTVAQDDDAVATLKAFVNAGAAEVGTHLHPWTCPPWNTRWDDAQTYPSELPTELLEAKLKVLTETLTEKFGRAPTSNRAGRWGFDIRFARMLQSMGYVVDSSVTPLVDWRNNPGARGGTGGPDFTHAPLHPYRLGGADATIPSITGLAEIPTTIVEDSRVPLAVSGWAGTLPEHHVFRRALNGFRLHRKLWFRPTLESVDSMVAAAEVVEREKVGVLNMMLHSSELFPNGSPYFADAASVDRLFDRMDGAFEKIFRRWNPEPMTLTDSAARLLPPS